MCAIYKWGVEYLWDLMSSYKLHTSLLPFYFVQCTMCLGKTIKDLIHSNNNIDSTYSICIIFTVWCNDVSIAWMIVLAEPEQLIQQNSFDTRNWRNAGLMLDQRLRLWYSVCDSGPTLHVNLHWVNVSCLLEHACIGVRPLAEQGWLQLHFGYDIEMIWLLLLNYPVGALSSGYTWFWHLPNRRNDLNMTRNSGLLVAYTQTLVIALTIIRVADTSIISDGTPQPSGQIENNSNKLIEGNQQIKNDNSTNPTILFILVIFFSLFSLWLSTTPCSVGVLLLPGYIVLSTCPDTEGTTDDLSKSLGNVGVRLLILSFLSLGPERAVSSCLKCFFTMFIVTTCK